MSTMLSIKLRQVKEYKRCKACGRTTNFSLGEHFSVRHPFCFECKDIEDPICIGEFVYLKKNSVRGRAFRYHGVQRVSHEMKHVVSTPFHTEDDFLRLRNSVHHLKTQDSEMYWQVSYDYMERAALTNSTASHLLELE